MFGEETGYIDWFERGLQVISSGDLLDREQEKTVSQPRLITKKATLHIQIIESYEPQCWVVLVISQSRESTVGAK